MLIFYSCSIGCYRNHQSIHTDVSGAATILPVLNGLPPKPPAVAFASLPISHIKSSGSSVGTNLMSSFESHADLQPLYVRYPQLRDQLKEIYETATGPLDDHLHDQHSSTGIADRGHGRGRGRGRSRGRGVGIPWSQERGLSAGLYRMRRLRHIKGDDGEGLREFSRLVTSIPEVRPSDSIGDHA